jgi:uncharacterized protein with ParB-like and HNH nuclease domain
MISKEDLKKQIDDKSKEVSTDSYTLSVSELANRYKDWDITINPKFQRVFRWDCYQKTRFIESLLLKIPIPAIFVSEDQNQKFEIVDGLQRTSTILEFMWYLHDGQDGISIRYPIRKGLIESEYLNLDGTTWDNLDEEWQRRIKNTRITLNIVQKDSDQKTKFDLFNRLNSWGSSLSSQETRNCIMIMIDDTFYDWIEKLSQNLDFIETMNFSEKILKLRMIWSLYWGIWAQNYMIPLVIKLLM